MRSYSELRRHHTFLDRFKYLSLGSEIGRSTFGFERFLNQDFYTSFEWRRARRDVIARDQGLDLGVEDYLISHHIHVHHMNPITIKDLERGDEDILNPEYLISTSLRTHNAIHFGNERSLPTPYVPRRAGDTKLW